MLRRLVDSLFGGSKTPPAPSAPEAPVLRNKAGGRAWIKAYGQDHGAHVLEGRPVKTVRLQEDGFWQIEPEQEYVLTTYYPMPGPDGPRILPPGTKVGVVALADSVLEPWKEDGISEEEVRELYDSDPLAKRHADGGYVPLPVYTFDNLPRQGQQ